MIGEKYSVEYKEKMVQKHLKAKEEQLLTIKSGLPWQNKDIFLNVNIKGSASRKNIEKIMSLVSVC